MNRDEVITKIVEEIIEKLSTELKLMLTSQTRTCANCTHIKSDGYCVRWHQRPPVDIIVTGCDNHFDHDSIPY